MSISRKGEIGTFRKDTWWKKENNIVLKNTTVEEKRILKANWFGFF